MKYIISTIIAILFAYCVQAQMIIQQQQQNVNINVPVIEKPVYIEKYRTVYVEKPRVAKQLKEPIVILGFLTVFPRDLGYYSSHPYDIISILNKQNTFGKNNWRLPTEDELRLMESYADEIGLGDDIYMASSHANGQLRLVSSGGNIESGEKFLKNNCAVKYNNLLWCHRNGIYGNRFLDGDLEKSERDVVLVQFNVPLGETHTQNDLNQTSIPHGWRLPTKQEFLNLLTNSELHVFLDMSRKTTGRLVLEGEIYDIKIPLEKADFRYEITGSVKYLVQGGVISLDFNIDLSDKDVQNLKQTGIIKRRGSELYNFTTFTSTPTIPAYVRLVRDL